MAPSGPAASTAAHPYTLADSWRRFVTRDPVPWPVNGASDCIVCIASCNFTGGSETEDRTGTTPENGTIPAKHSVEEVSRIGAAALKALKEWWQTVVPAP